MKRILLFGAGKSATCLIEYLIKEINVHRWELVVVDSNLSLARSKIGDTLLAKALAVDVEDPVQRDELIRNADLVISLLPPALHFLIAASCIREGRNLLTASYMDDAITGEAGKILEKGLLFICEMGLDPGIDHMSALQLIHRIQSQGGRIYSFKSHTGGLVAPSSDDNPWHYKVSWNPRNVVLAGSAGAIFKEAGKIVNKPYKDIFKSYRRVGIDGVGKLAWYPNRDSLGYMPLYGLEDASTFIRTTLRYESFCEAWASLVDAGLTDDKVPLPAKVLHFKDWSERVGPFINSRNKEALEFLGVFDDLPVPVPAKSNADILQYLLETKLAMQPGDKDMIVMLHELEYKINDQEYRIRSSLMVEGADHLRTAMAKTVGLPLGIIAKLILEERIHLKGLHRPVLPEIYSPVMEELDRHGIRFIETAH